MSYQKKQPIYARQEWNRSTVSKSDWSYKTDNTWMIPFEHHASNNSRLIFKAGNKEYTLDASKIDPNGRPTIPEIALKKRYA
jgi:hypothetical protein